MIVDGSGHSTPTLHLEGESTTAVGLLTGVWRSRHLLLMLARKDFFVRYRRASFGLFWAVGLPLFQAIVLAIVFSRVARIHTEGNYAVFVLAGMVAWTYFSSTVSPASTAIVDGSELSTKIYFPRAILPLATVASNVYALAPAIVVLLAACVLTGDIPGGNILLLPVAVVALVALSAGFALVLSALHVYFRDVRHLLQAALLAWFYVTPIIYPLSLTGGLSQWIRLNPLTGVIELFRAATIGTPPDLAASVVVSAVWTMVLLGAAIVLHRRYDRVFVDLL
jgi:ABC-type polysaccharide/polyol phosphate export permease